MVVRLPGASLPVREGGVVKRFDVAVRLRRRDVRDVIEPRHEAVEIVVTHELFVSDLWDPGELEFTKVVEVVDVRAGALGERLTKATIAGAGRLEVNLHAVATGFCFVSDGHWWGRSVEEEKVGGTVNDGFESTRSAVVAEAALCGAGV